MLAPIPLVFLFWEPAAHLDAPGRVFFLHLLHLMFLGSGLAVLYVTGRSALRRAGFLPDDPAERILLAISAGFVLASATLFFLAASGALRPGVIWALAAGACALLARNSRRYRPDALPRTLYAPSGTGGEGSGLSGVFGHVATGVSGAVLGLLFLGSGIEALHPSPQSPDALAHNLAYARLFADSRGYIVTPDSPLYFALAGYWEIFLAAFASFTRSEVTLLVLAQLQNLILGLGGAALGIVCLVRRFLTAEKRAPLVLGLLGAILFVGMNIDVTHVRLFPLLSVEAKSDLIVTALQVSAALVIFRIGGSGGDFSARNALFAGVLLGTAAGVKLTAGVAAVGIAAALLLYPPRALGAGERGRMVGWLAVGVIGPLAPMLLKNAAGLGNPVYPLLVSVFKGFDNPAYFEHLHGFSNVHPFRTFLAMSPLAAPTAGFVFLAGMAWRRLAPRGAYFLLFASGISLLTIVFVFSEDFPRRYVLFLSAFSAVAASCGMSALIQGIRSDEGKRLRMSSRHALRVAWAVLILIALSTTHLENRLKRALQIVTRTPRLAERPLRMNPTSRFQAGWPGKLPPEARPLTFYRPEALYALGGGWRPTVALHSPEIIALFAREKDPAALEKKLVEKGISHFYFESNPEETRFSVRPDAFVNYLRKRNPLWRDAGFEIFALQAGSKSP